MSVSALSQGIKLYCFWILYIDDTIDVKQILLQKKEKSMKKTVIVYTTNDCIECTMVKKVLTEEGIAFDAKDISQNPAYRKEVEKYGFLGVPVTVLGDKAVKGFTNELKGIIELAKNEFVEQ
jgi:glutaredoxin-like protein NrdH